MGDEDYPSLMYAHLEPGEMLAVTRPEIAAPFPDYRMGAENACRFLFVDVPVYI